MALQLFEPHGCWCSSSEHQQKLGQELGVRGVRYGGQHTGTATDNATGLEQMQQLTAAAHSLLWLPQHSPQFHELSSNFVSFLSQGIRLQTAAGCLCCTPRRVSVAEHPRRCGPV
jgi:hypothetical protein